MPCKLYQPRAGKFIAGATVNLSGSGVLIDISRTAFFEAGERLRVGIPEDAGAAVLSAADLRDAHVAWTVRTPGRTLVGLRYAEATSRTARAA